MGKCDAERLEYLEEVTRKTGDMLSRIVDVAGNEESLQTFASAKDILTWGNSLLSTFIGYDAVAFFLVDEETLEFSMAFCSDADLAPHISSEVDDMVDSGHFGFVVQSSRASTINDRRGNAITLHPLSTASQEIGMFVGVRKKGNGNLLETVSCHEAFLTIILQRISLMLENFAIYEELEQVNAALEKRNRRNVSKLSHVEKHDAITGLSNRATLMEEMVRRVSSSLQEKFALILLDLNRFKDLNEAVGNRAGDMILKQVGNRIKAVTRKGDVVARLAGDEFGILTNFSKSRKEVIKLSERIATTIENPIKVAEGLEIRPTARLGIALFPEHADDMEDLWKAAQSAMEMAKKQKLMTTTCQVYVPTEERSAIDKVLLLSDLREAIENREIDLFFQPKKSLSTGKLCGAEALARWISPKRGFVSPGDFIPLAEKSGFIKGLTESVVEKGFWCISKMGKAGFTIPVSINLSMLNLQDPGLSSFVEASMNKFGIDPGMVEFEMTESALVEQSDIVISNLRFFKEMGMRLSIDDFGTGFSSYSYLCDLDTHMDVLKMDMSFVRGMDTDDRKRIIVESIIEMGHKFDMEVVAEGVETDTVEQILCDMGCDIIQGYYYSKPLPKKEFSRFLYQLSGLRKEKRH